MELAAKQLWISVRKQPIFVDHIKAEGTAKPHSPAHQSLTNGIVAKSNQNSEIKGSGRCNPESSALGYKIGWVKTERIQGAYRIYPDLKCIGEF